VAEASNNATNFRKPFKATNSRITRVQASVDIRQDLLPVIRAHWDLGIRAIFAATSGFFGQDHSDYADHIHPPCTMFVFEE
jgi:hypothetical protein